MPFNLINGTTGKDLLIGTTLQDNMFRLGGDDTILTGPGYD